jgi:hypothetical protein
VVLRLDDLVFAALVLASLLGLLLRAVTTRPAATVAPSGHTPRTRSPGVASAAAGGPPPAPVESCRGLRYGVILMTIFGPVRRPEPPSGA